MEKPILLSSSVGEIVAPQTMVTALMIAPDGTVTLDPGVLHGRSALEGSLQMVAKRDEVPEPQTHRVVWIAVELDAANKPLCYKGLSVADMFVNASARVGFKSLAQQVNRMSEAMRGDVNVNALPASVRQGLKQQLLSIGRELWTRSSEALRQALEAA